MITMIDSPKIEFTQSVSLENREFQLFRKLIYELSGINLENHKKELLRARLFKRLRICGLQSYGEYYDFIVSQGKDGTEKAELLNAISTNKTEFFRENAHSLFG